MDEALSIMGVKIYKEEKAVRVVRNKELREEIKKRNLYMWEVAELVGIHATTFMMWLRTDITPERKARVDEALKKYDAEQEKGQPE